MTWKMAWKTIGHKVIRPKWLPISQKSLNLMTVIQNQFGVISQIQSDPIANRQDYHNSDFDGDENPISITTLQRVSQFADEKSLFKKGEDNKDDYSVRNEEDLDNEKKE